ncbi:MAG: heme lyase NrfEFG subunit NrfE, partial [Rhodobacteraceae bacterium]|nr:heme lyase NrfEFG subunit NrfE [Paracoccaceae bacterium]
HSALVVERRQTLIVWTILLAILTFSLSLIGTFVVRSGVITSVHAFATDPARGVGVLAILVIFTGGALCLFAARGRGFDQSVSFRPVSREGALILNNILLVVATGTVFLGTFYPLFVELTGPEKISVGPPYFNRTFGPIMVILGLALSAGPFLRWKRDGLRAALARLRWPLTMAGLLAAAAIFALGPGAALGLGLAAWLVLGAVWIVVARAQPFRMPSARSWTLLRTTPLAVWGTVLGHAGLGLLIAGITCVTLWDDEVIVALREGESATAGGYIFTLREVRVALEANYEVERATFDVTRNGAPVTTLEAQRRYYPVSGKVTTEAAIAPRFLSNLYVSVSGPSSGNTWGARIYHHPFVLLIWLGPLLMAFGGFLSLIDRRFRVGALAARPNPTVAPA